jgi:S-adenosylmethionine-dependent methyltransferase
VAEPDEEFSFAPGVAAWRQGLGQVRDAVRQELVARQLATHLPPTGDLTVLDLGCGQATQAIRLARAGYRVTGLDASDDLLALARAAAAAEPEGVGDRLRFQRGDIADLDDAFRGAFDVVCCHGVLMYLPSLGDAVSVIVGAARPGGLISLLTRNRAGLAMRAGMSGAWRDAGAAFDARYYRNRLGIDQVRADDPDEVRAAIEAAGGRTVAWYGVRLFTDHWGDLSVPDDFADLVAAEAEAGRRDPYRWLAALTHTLATLPR